MHVLTAALVQSDTTDNTSNDSERPCRPGDDSVTNSKDKWYVDEVGSVNNATGTSKHRSKKVRKSRRSELLELRKLVEMYEKTLDSLLTHKHEKFTVNYNNFWKRTAHRIALEKRLSLRDNERLRLLAGHQINIIKELQLPILATITNANVRAP